MHELLREDEYDLDILSEQIVRQPPTTSIKHIVGADPDKDDYGEYNEPPPEGTPFTNPDVDPFSNVADTDPRLKVTKGPAALQGRQKPQDVSKISAFKPLKK